MREYLDKAEHDMEFVLDDLCAVLNRSSNVGSIVILELIKEAAELNKAIKNFSMAYNYDHKDNS